MITATYILQFTADENGVSMWYRDNASRVKMVSNPNVFPTVYLCVLYYPGKINGYLHLNFLHVILHVIMIRKGTGMT